MSNVRRQSEKCSKINIGSLKKLYICRYNQYKTSMKRIIFILCLVLFAGKAGATDPVYLLERFTEAKMYFSNGTFAEGRVNYELTTGKVQYLLDGELMEVPDDNNMTSIVFPGGRTFIQHSPNKFYEQIRRENGSTVEIYWKLKEVNVGNVGAYGTTTQAAVTSLRITTLPGGGTTVGDYEHPVYQKDVFQQKSDNEYIFSKNGKDYKVKTLKNVYKAFSSQQDKIKAFVEEKKLSMLNAGEALQVIDFVLAL